MRESLVCTSPFFLWLLLSEYWFHANHPTIVIDQTIANRVVQSSYLRWHNFQQPANFLVCTLVDIFISFICGDTTILLHYSDGHCCYSHHTIERIEMKSLLSLSLRELVSVFVLDTLSSTWVIHIPSLCIYHWERIHLQSSFGTILTG